MLATVTHSLIDKLSFSNLKSQVTHCTATWIAASFTALQSVSCYHCIATARFLTALRLAKRNSYLQARFQLLGDLGMTFRCNSEYCTPSPTFDMLSLPLAVEPLSTSPLIGCKCGSIETL